MGILNKKRCMMYFMITAVVTVTSVINLKKIYETHEMLYRLEHWDDLDDNEKEAMETLKFIGTLIATQQSSLFGFLS